MTTAVQTRRGQALIAPDLFRRLERRIAADHPELAPGMPARILDQALAFLAACATTTRPIGPSDLVDIGWHTFILYTREYAAFCDRIAGRFIHHEPDDAPGGEGPTVPKCVQTPAASPDVPLAAAVEAIRSAYYHLDDELWLCSDGIKCSQGKCTQCHAGCHDSPTG